jgi:hypothetical protein
MMEVIMTVAWAIYNALTAIVVAGLNIVDAHPVMALGIVIIVGALAGVTFNETRIEIEK